MKQRVDIMIVGAGPVGLMCAYLAQLCGLTTVIIDKSSQPLQVGRADALNARSLQLLELVNLFDELYPLGKLCNTSSVWADGKFVSRQSCWWDNLQGCFHKHFLMLGQAYIEQLLDSKLTKLNAAVTRNTTVNNIKIDNSNCVTIPANGEKIYSRYIIGADGSHSYVRKKFNVNYTITRPQITWAVVDGIIETDFPKVPEIIVFQAQTSDVAWIPREGDIDRFYIRMDKQQFTFDEVMVKINHAIKPHKLHFKKVTWSSQFSVKESIAERFIIDDKVFLAGDAAHIHSVNGGQGLNTGIADAFNLIWKINRVIKYQESTSLLSSYHQERKAVAESVIATSANLVRTTKYSKKGTHAQDYVKIIEQRAGNITGMGIAYPGEGLAGKRLHDFELYRGDEKTRIYRLLDYGQYTLLLFGNQAFNETIPSGTNVMRIQFKANTNDYWTDQSPYAEQAILVRPDAYIDWTLNLKQKSKLSGESLPL